MNETTPDTAYATRNYLAGGRAVSFGHQIHAILSLEPTSVLEVGVGAGVVAASLRRVGLPVTTLDIDPALEPDLLASVTEIPAEESTWSVASCCQVLEHLPFERFGDALRELHRVTSRGLVLSLPDVTRDIEFRMRLPRLGTRRFSAPVPLPPRRIPADRMTVMGHHWEIGFAGTSRAAVEAVFAVVGWDIERSWRVPELPWHRFHILRHAAGTKA